MVLSKTYVNEYQKKNKTWWAITVELKTLTVSFTFIIERGVRLMCLYVTLSSFNMIGWKIFLYIMKISKILLQMIVFSQTRVKFLRTTCCLQLALKGCWFFHQIRNSHIFNRDVNLCCIFYNLLLGTIHSLW